MKISKVASGHWHRRTWFLLARVILKYFVVVATSSERNREIPALMKQGLRERLLASQFVADTGHYQRGAAEFYQ